MKEEKPDFGVLQNSKIISSLTSAVESYLIRYRILSGPSALNFKVEKILVMFSGGVDSSVLLHLLQNIYTKKDKYCKKKIHLLHINYHLRGEESDAEAKAIKALATIEGITLHQFDEYLPTTSGNIQGLARSCRYAHAKAISKAENIFHVLTAHHLDDQLETFLLNLLKGKSPKTLASNNQAAKLLGLGMDIGSELNMDSGHSSILLHRPFIASETSKEELLQYSKIARIRYLNDSSNAKSDYERNYLRNKIIPQIAKDERFPGWERNLLRVMDYLQRENELIRELSESYLSPSLSGLEYGLFRDLGLPNFSLPNYLNAKHKRLSFTMLLLPIFQNTALLTGRSMKY